MIDNSQQQERSEQLRGEIQELEKNIQRRWDESLLLQTQARQYNAGSEQRMECESRIVLALTLVDELGVLHLMKVAELKELTGTPFRQ